MSFKDQVARDIRGIFLNLDEFGEPRTVLYDGNSYESIPVVLHGIREASREQVTQDDHVQGLYKATDVMHCALADIGGVLPEHGTRIRISDADRPKYFHEYYVLNSTDVMGMVRAELSSFDE